jgi:hypothetical protein
VRIYMENESTALRATRLLVSALTSDVLGQYEMLNISADASGAPLYNAIVMMLMALEELGVPWDIDAQPLRDYLREIANELPAFAADRHSLLCILFEGAISKMNATR